MPVFDDDDLCFWIAPQPHHAFPVAIQVRADFLDHVNDAQSALEAITKCGDE